MVIGYVIIAVLYLILTLKQDHADKFWLYAMVAAVYLGMGLGVKFLGEQ